MAEGRDSGVMIEILIRARHLLIVDGRRTLDILKAPDKLEKIVLLEKEQNREEGKEYFII
jgi:hypothetical protein